jgi:hypothetical protein
MPAPGSAAAGWRAQRRRSIMKTSTMITIKTMVPIRAAAAYRRLRFAGNAGTGAPAGRYRAALPRWRIRSSRSWLTVVVSRLADGGGLPPGLPEPAPHIAASSAARPRRRRS